MTTAVARPRPHIPGEPGIWMFIVGDMLMFSLLFIIYMYYRSGAPELFNASQAQLNQTLGLINTLLMLTSSWLVASGVQAARRGAAEVVTKCFRWTILCGAAFLCVKVVEYGEKIGAGLNMWTNDFFMLYFCYTGIHMIHVVLGMGVVAGLMRYSRAGDFSGNRLRNIETGVTFWHLVDLIWVILFGLLYLVGQS